MKTITLCLVFGAFFGISHGYVIERRIPLDADVVNDVLNFTEISLKDPKTYVATVNEYGDKILANLDRMLARDEMDPLPVEDVYEGYWWGHIKLNKIEVDGLSSIYRPSDAVMTYSHYNKQLQLDLPMSIKKLEFKCHFKAALMYVGPSGKITGKVSEVLMQTSLIIDYNFNQAFLRTFEIVDSGHISIHIHSFFLSDWIFNLLSDAVTAIFHGTILNSATSSLQQELSSVMDVIDDILEKILG